MSSEAEGLAKRIRSREITRLCHLTPSRNLVHIATGPGLVSTGALRADERIVFTQQDALRLDGKLEHISCSIQYPNVWYFRQKKNPVGEASNFRDWVVLGVRPDCMLKPDTLFCPSNAAGGAGTNLGTGCEGFDAMYADQVVDSRGRVFSRQSAHLRPCPTNDQAEVMIPGQVLLDDVTTIFVPTSAQAARVHVQLEQVGGDPGRFGYVIAPSFFEARQLSNEIRNGSIPTEIEWHAPS